MNPIPESWLRMIPEMSGRRSLTVAGLEVTVDLTAGYLQDAVLPVLNILNQRAESTPTRVLAGLAGIPAGGKTVFSACLEHVAPLLPGMGSLQVIPMDGWHYPNAILDARVTHDDQGRPVPLRHRKGGPESYDVDALAGVLERLRLGEEVRLPVYDRRRHEPEPDAMLVPASTRIMLLEGNYVLGGVPGAEKWDRIATALSPRFYIECDRGLARDRMIARHMRGGSTGEEAIEKYERNDRINTALIERAAMRADYLLSPEPPALRRIDLEGRAEKELPASAD